MRAIGLDLGRTTGYAVLDSEEGFVHRTWKLDEGTPRRLIDFDERLVDALECHMPELVVYEEVQFVVSRAQISLYAQLSGLVLMECYNWGIPCKGLPTGTLKKFATGNGKASKENMIEAAQLFLDPTGRRRPTLTSDEADAICLARWGIGNADR